MMWRIAMTTKYVLATLVSGLCAAAALAQQPAPEPAAPPDKLFFLENMPPLATMGAKIDIIRSEGGVPGPVVAGKPYSARSITESTQMLADGNRIAQKNERSEERRVGKECRSRKSTKHQ